MIHGSRPGNVLNIVARHENNARKKMNISKSDIGLTRLQEDEVSSSFTIIVDIINTTVDIEILHQVLCLALFMYKSAHMQLVQSFTNHLFLVESIEVG